MTETFFDASDNAFNDFDPDQFDWDGDANVKPEGFDFDLVDSALNVALAVHEEHFGWTYVKESALRERAKKLFHVKVVMPEEHREWFEKTWPEYLFVWDTASQHHDHPRSHLATELNEIEMVERLIASGTPYADLFGNPGRDAKYKRTCLTLYKKACARDYVRYQHAHKFKQAELMDWNKLVKGGYRLGGKRIHDVTLTHALYYMQLGNVAEFCNAHPLNRMHAIVHRHPLVSGTLNAGELSYTVDEEGIVTQQNVATGETYVHPSVEALFHQFSAQTSNGGLAWTVRQLGGDSFLIEFVGCPNSVCGEYVPFKYLKSETRSEETFNSVVVKKFLHFTWCWTIRNNTKVLLPDADLLAKLRRYQAGRLRGPRQKTELMTYARRLVNKEDIIAIHGGGAHVVPVGSIVDYVEAAFYMDVRHELEVAISHYKQNKTYTDALNVYIEKGELPIDLTVPSAVIHTVDRTMDKPGVPAAMGVVMAACSAALATTTVEKVGIGLFTAAMLPGISQASPW